MRTTIERVVEVSRHRSERALGFSALRPHKPPASTSAADAARSQSGAASTGAASAASDGGYSGHESLVHADLSEQEAARRASAPAALNTARRAGVGSHNEWMQQARNANGVGVGGGAAGEAGAGGDVAMRDTGDSCAEHGGLNSTAGAAGHGGSAGRAVDVGEALAGSREDAERGILLKDVLFILEKEKSVGVRRIILKHSLQQDPALHSWRASR